MDTSFLEINQLKTQNDQMNVRFTRQLEEIKQNEAEISQMRLMNQELQEKINHLKYSYEEVKEKATIIEEEYFKLKQ